jgi:hypothetical protein
VWRALNIWLGYLHFKEIISSVKTVNVRRSMQELAVCLDLQTATQPRSARLKIGHV